MRPEPRRSPMGGRPGRPIGPALPRQSPRSVQPAHQLRGTSPSRPADPRCRRRCWFTDASEVGAWLVECRPVPPREVGALDLIPTAHASWNGERTRPPSALEDRAYVIVTLTRGEGDDATRYLRATGRDVDVDRAAYQAQGIGVAELEAAIREMDDAKPAVVTFDLHPNGSAVRHPAAAAPRPHLVTTAR